MRKNPLTLSWSGDVRFGGDASFCLFVLMVPPGGLHQNPLMVPSRHTHKNRLIITSSVDPGKSWRQQLLILSIAGLLDQERHFSFEWCGYTWKLSKAHPNPAWLLIHHPLDSARTFACSWLLLWALMGEIKNGWWREMVPWSSNTSPDWWWCKASSVPNEHSGFTGFTGSAYHPTFSGKVWFGNFSLIVFSGLSCIIAFFLHLA